MKNVLIIEDEPGVQLTLEDLLRSEGYTVVVKGDGLEGEKEAKTDAYDLILLDVMLPGKDGFAVCRSLRKQNISTPIIMLTARDTNIDTVMGLKQGADDYLTKPFDAEVLLARMEAVTRRFTAKKAIRIDTIQFGGFTLDTIQEELSTGADIVPLQVQEYRLLHYLVTHPNQILSRNKLLDEVWGYDSESTTRTVDVHIGKLRNKLEESDIPKYILTIRGRGYKFKKY
jgi:two-component system, OmpR family, alkaline phosphatase synthesis response regulator PhoP